MSRAYERRQFLALCGAAMVGATAGCASISYVPGTLEGERLLVARSDVDAKGFALVEHAKLAFPVYVHRWEDGHFTAVLTRCMHRGCTVEPGVGKLVCPCHGSEYAFGGAIVKGPTELPLIEFPVTATADQLIIHDVARGMK